MKDNEYDKNDILVQNIASYCADTALALMRSTDPSKFENNNDIKTGLVSGIITDNIKIIGDFLYLDTEESGLYNSFVIQVSMPKGTVHLRSDLELNNSNDNMELIDQTNDIEQPDMAEKLFNILIFKTTDIIDSSIPLQFQLNTMIIPNDYHNSNSTKKMSSILSNGIGSMLNILGNSNNQKLFSNDSIVSTRRKLKDITNSLDNLQSSIIIPNFSELCSPIITTCISENKNTLTIENYRSLFEDLHSDTTKINDTSFLNSVHSSVNKWIKLTKLLLKSERNINDGNFFDELNYFKNLINALNITIDQFQSLDLQISLNILIDNGRFNNNQFSSLKSELTEKLHLIQSYSSFLNALNLSNIQNVSSLDDFQIELQSLYINIKKIRNQTNYPLARFIKLIDHLYILLLDKFLSLIPNIFASTYSNIELEILFSNILETIRIWKNYNQDLTLIVRELLRKIVNDNEMPNISLLKFKPSTIMDKFEKTILDIKKLIKFNMDFSNSLSRLINIESINIDALIEPFILLGDNMKNLIESWKVYKKDYNRHFEVIENRIIVIMKQDIQDSKEKTNLFDRFLRYRDLSNYSTKINLSLMDTRDLLLDSLEHEFQKLMEKYNTYDQFLELSTAINNNPKILSEISFLYQISKRSKYLQSHLEIVLGYNWKDSHEGKIFIMKFPLIFQINKSYLQNIFENWLNDSINYNKLSKNNSMISYDVPLLKIVKEKNNTFDIDINFNFDWYEIFNCIRDISFYGITVPQELPAKRETYNNIFSYAISIREQIQTFFMVIEELNLREFCKIILNDKIEDAWNHLKKALFITWGEIQEHSKKYFLLDGAHESTYEFFFSFESSIETVVEYFQIWSPIEDQIFISLQKLISIDFQPKLIDTYLNEIQKIIDSIENYDASNLDKMINYLNEKIINCLMQKLKSDLQNFKLTPIEVELQFDEGTVVSNKDNFYIKNKWINEVNTKIHHISNIKLIHLTNKPKSHRLLVTNILKSIRPEFEYALSQIQNISLSFKSSINTLNRYCLVYLATKQDLLQILNQDFKKCYDILKDNFLSKTRFSNFIGNLSSTPLLIVKYKQVQILLLKRYEYWQHILCEHLFSLYTKQTSEFSSKVNNLASELSSVKIELSDITSITYISKQVMFVEEQNAHFHNQLETIRNSESLFKTLQYKLPEDFLYSSKLVIYLSNLRKVTKNQSDILVKNRSIIVKLVEDEYKRLDSALRNISNDWNINRPSPDTILPDDGLQKICNYEQTIIKLNTDYNAVLDSAKQILIPMKPEFDYHPILKAIINAKKAWSYLESFFKEYNSLINMTWNSLDINSSIHSLENLLGKINMLDIDDNNLYIFDNLKSDILLILQNSDVLILLTDESLKDRHWSTIFFELSDSTSVTDDLINDYAFKFYDVISLKLDLILPELNIIIEQAKKEFTLEKVLNKLKKYWKSTKYDFLEYDNALKIVQNWELLEEHLSQDLEDLTAMKNSTYYKIFEQDCLDWQNKLTSLSNIHSNWIEFQLLWIELHSLFDKNTEIKTILPLELSKFESITADFKMLMERIYQLHNVIDVIFIPNCHNIILKMHDSLTIIKRSLIEYLEKERTKYPRFYFLGNADMLQVISAGNDIRLVSKFMQSIFGTIIDLIVDDSEICGVISKEGEHFLFIKSIPLHDIPQAGTYFKLIEDAIKITLIQKIELYSNKGQIEINFSSLLQKESFQVCLLLFQLYWTNTIETTFLTNDLQSTLLELKSIMDSIVALRHQDSPILLQKIKNFLSECIFYYDLIKKIKELSSEALKLLEWSKVPKYYYNSDSHSISVRFGTQNLNYGYCYIGVPERLIYTPLVLDGFASMIQSFSHNFGSCLFGPAGTGKTETAKMVSQNLGRQIIVFNCDEAFDSQAINRLLLGIGQIGAWGCFDEFNRLTPNVLSAVSGCIEMIQDALSHNGVIQSSDGHSSSIHPNSGIIITLNPSYAGRSELPENLRKKFIEFSFQKPDKVVIAENILRIEGINNIDNLAANTVLFLDNMTNDCTPQKHYDFGLRSLKSIISTCTTLYSELNDVNLALVCSLQRILLPRLTIQDTECYNKNLNTIFPRKITTLPFLNDFYLESLRNSISNFVLSTSDELEIKCHQFINIQESQKAVICTGPTGVGKTATIKASLMAIEDASGITNDVFTIDTKTLNKKELYGFVNPITLEWKDGLFTSIVRKAYQDSYSKDIRKNTWIIFDSDIDPEYIETINSVLDDNHLLTLPTGERIPIIPSVHLIFETDNLDFATPATISRCGVILFEKQIFTSINFLKNCYMSQKQEFQLLHSNAEDLITNLEKIFFTLINEETLQKYFDFISNYAPIMSSNSQRIIKTIVSLYFSFLSKFWSQFQKQSDSDFEDLVSFSILQLIVLGFVGDCNTSDQKNFISKIQQAERNNCIKFCEFESPMEWTLTSNPLNLSRIDDLIHIDSLKPQEITSPNIVISTVDTYKHEQILTSLIDSNTPVILCGPPGSGKTMVIHNIIKKNNNLELISLNFSKDTTLEHIRKTLERNMIYSQTPTGYSLTPKSSMKDIVIFCDEINLPKLDKYGSQPAILFLRQLVEKNGFWNTEKNKWVNIERVHFIGACNPESDVGRQELSQRFIRHTCVLYIDYPTDKSLLHIYGTFYDAVFQLLPLLRNFSSVFSKASVMLFEQYKLKFTTNKYSHYFCSPRELTRWVKGFYLGINNGSFQSLSNLVRMWAHEAWRIFADKLTSIDEKTCFLDLLNSIVMQFFPGQVFGNLDSSSLLFSNWMSFEYKEVELKDLTSFIMQRLQIYLEEEISTPLILYKELVDHILRINRVLHQYQGHIMLVGPYRTGKKSVTRFVAWLNGFTIVEPAIHNSYSLGDFDEFLKDVLLRCAIEEETVCLLVDESHILHTSFIERINNLLSNSDIPDLFHGEDYDKLLNIIATKTQSLGLTFFSDKEMYEWFVNETAKNLHVVFTLENLMYDKENQLSSPALLNRCVINWMNEWSNETMVQIMQNMLGDLPLDFTKYTIPKDISSDLVILRSTSLIDAIFNIFLVIDHWYHETLNLSFRTTKCFLSSITDFRNMFNKHFIELEDNQRFLITGLEKLNEAVFKVQELNNILTEKREELVLKEEEAKKTLNLMLHEQNEAERKQEATIEIKEILTVREKEVQARRSRILQDLESIQPIINEAQQGVQNIKKQHLIEIRSMNNPPPMIKFTLEAVCWLLGYGPLSWKEVQQIIRKEGFISNMVEFDTKSSISAEVVNLVKTNYLNNEQFTYENVLRASRACGPLFNWITAQVEYHFILNSVGPLREEINIVESDRREAQARLLAAQEMIDELEISIEESKLNYSGLIRDIELIKDKLKKTELQLERANLLVSNLTSERARWKKSSISFTSSRNKIVGNCLLSSFYCNYCSSLNEKERNNALLYFKKLLDSFEIIYEHNFEFGDHNIQFSNRIEWVELGLPNEDLYLDNFQMLISCNNTCTPYIIDPNNEIISVLHNIYGEKLVISSFLEKNFIYKVKNAVQFGQIILIQDSEYFDPIITSLLNKEFRRQNSISTILIDAQIIDVSNDFKMILYSTDPNGKISSYLDSRVKLINFSINKASIESKSLRLTIESEAPEIQEKRENIMKLNGEYKVILEDLEVQLLKSIQSTEGNILDDTELLETLESLKEEATMIEDKLQETNDFMIQSTKVTNKYMIISKHCFRVYELLDKLMERHWFLNISITQYLECFVNIFKEDTYQYEEDTSLSRVEVLLKRFYITVYEFFSPMLPQELKLVFACALNAYYIESQNVNPQNTSFEESFISILKSITRNDNNTITLGDPQYENNEFHLKKLIRDYNDGRYLLGFESFINDLFSNDQLKIEKFIKTNNLIGLGTYQDVDGTFRIEEVARKVNKKLIKIPLGSEENIYQIEQQIAKLQNLALGKNELEDNENFDWLLLENVQMSLRWFTEEFYEKIQTIITNNEPGGQNNHQMITKGKIFFSYNLNGEILPVEVIRNSYKIVYENKDSVLTTVRELWEICLETEYGKERDHQDKQGKYSNNYEQRNDHIMIFEYMKFFLCWFHSILVGKCQLAPIGFTRRYDFNQRDFQCGLNYLQEFFDKGYYTEGTNRSSHEIPKTHWASIQLETICYTLGRIIYGGKTDNTSDMKSVMAICSEIIGNNIKKLLKTISSNSIPKSNPNSSDNLKIPSYNEAEIIPGVRIKLHRFTAEAQRSEENFSDSQEEGEEGPLKRYLTKVLADLNQSSVEPNEWLLMEKEAVQQYEKLAAQKVSEEILRLIE
ncbi:hypothetical protein TBLA_0D05690 [Henningerozyma blattae CBS 6284]|uniref:Dynein heavy chain, cytoplasmic n=1 Tax=Henningerozyma blattae (strain ATCC 34711 / CBS 6284 / DSM 70876 / NBRC 10599 / NRRL Y-10934 / UCD 77-7) TaxID=1071380 RepID=I2H3V9_HENB6|nr:hypothetical protein TBLA_0D05690 [Tetrapisispora blattae CBS 6284]CCH61061.1 hypothetical protein TBLA_0D05690 [Tetrapisispora blattae CBS 6284]